MGSLDPSGRTWGRLTRRGVQASFGGVGACRRRLAGSGRPAGFAGSGRPGALAGSGRPDVHRSSVAHRCAIIIKLFSELFSLASCWHRVGIIVLAYVGIVLASSCWHHSVGIMLASCWHHSVRIDRPHQELANMAHESHTCTDSAQLRSLEPTPRVDKGSTL